MILPDVNVLVNAFRADATYHALCRQWLDRIIREDARFGISPLVLSAVVRISTNRRAFEPPSTLPEALGFCDDLLGQPHCEVVSPGPRHWRIFKQVCRDAKARADLVTDAWFAALAIEWGCEWITLDRDYARFPGLKWRVPDNR
jgi:uncharacterized protein